MGHSYGSLLFIVLLHELSDFLFYTDMMQLELGWGIAVMCMSSVKSYTAFYGLRFLVGIFE